MRSRRLFWGLALLAAAQIHAAKPWLVAEDGEARVAVVVAEDATDTVKSAAATLSHYLEKVTGASFPHRSSTATTSDHRILVGPGAATLATPPVASSFGDEEFLIRRQGGDLVLIGGEPRGTIYAVQAFLEDVVGCRWWAVDAETIPNRQTLSVPDIDWRDAPAFDYRMVLYEGAHDPKWAMHNRLNGHRYKIPEAQGGYYRYRPFVHTFDRILPPAMYFDKHPDWYALRDGQRVGENSQLCLTNPEMTAEYIQRYMTGLRRKALPHFSSVSQNDNSNFCECEPCRALEAREGGPSGPLMAFVNTVAEAVESEFPDLIVTTLAYERTLLPPKNIRPRANVLVRLCTIKCSFRTPIARQHKREFPKALARWSALGVPLHVWDYIVNFNHYLQPHPNWTVQGPNLRLFRKYGVKGVFSQGAYRTTGTELAELRAWLVAKLLWDPDQDQRQLTEEFVEGYYGAAAVAPLMAYLDYAPRTVRKSWTKLGCYCRNDEDFLSPAFLEMAWGCVERAEQAMADDAVRQLRIRRMKLGLRYVLISRWHDLRSAYAKEERGWPLGDDASAALSAFAEDLAAYGVTHIGERHVGIERLEKMLDEQLAARIQPEE